MEPKKSCSGCGACSGICPVSAISKHFNEFGWFEYKIDADRCVNCGLCEKICPSNCDPTTLIHFNNSVKYAAYSLDADSVKKSSSGGLAYEIGKVGIEHGYRVVGTFYNYETNTAQWGIADCSGDLEKFRGSKYIQADTEDVVKEVLKNEGKYIVIGTPCQIYGMRKLTEKKKYKGDLLFIDFVCHGTPSYEIWNAYLRECTTGKITSVNFRDKTYGWHKISLKIESDKGTSLQKRDKSSFFKAFDDGFFYNEQCYRCELNNGNGVSDIRMEGLRT